MASTAVVVATVIQSPLPPRRRYNKYKQSALYRKVQERNVTRAGRNNESLRDCIHKTAPRVLIDI